MALQFFLLRTPCGLLVHYKWGLSMNTIVILIVAIINFIIGFSTAIIASRYRNKASGLITTYIVSQKFSIRDVQLTKPMLNQLQRLIQQKFPTIVITMQTLSKRRINTTLTVKEIATPSLLDIKPIDVDDEVKTEFGDHLFWSDYLATISFLSVFLGLCSLFSFILIRSEWDILAVSSLPVFILLLIAIGPLVNNMRKKRNIKVSKEID